MPVSARDDALIVVDVQNDFLPGGALAVPRGDEVIAPINALIQRFERVVLTQDWHPAGHVSFASSHAGRQPFEVIRLAYGDQVLWPDHCVQGTAGAAIAADLDTTKASAIIRKGLSPNVDSYSGFLEADRTARTGLASYLKELGVRRVFLAGLATDFCVAWTALDAQAAGFETLVVEDACGGIDTNGSLSKALDDLTAKGIRLTTASAVRP